MAFKIRQWPPERALLRNLFIMAGIIHVTWAALSATRKTILGGAKTSSDIIYGDTVCEEIYHRFYISEMFLVIVGLVFIAAVIARGNVLNITGLLFACLLSIVRTSFSVLYLVRLQENPLKYAIFAKYHVYGVIHYRDSETVEPISEAELSAEISTVIIGVVMELCILVAMLLIVFPEIILTIHEIRISRARVSLEPYFLRRASYCEAEKAEKLTTGSPGASSN